MRLLPVLSLATIFTCTALSAGHAQRYIPNLEGRLEKLEQAVGTVQNKSKAAQSSASGLANLQGEMAQMQEEMRRLRGAMEENRHALDMIKREIKLSAEDTEFRLQALESGGSMSAVPSSAAPPAVPQKPVVPKPEPVATPAPEHVLQMPKEPAAMVVPTPNIATPATQGSGMQFTNARDHYNYAMSLIKEKRYDRARDSLNRFLGQHPDDRLVGNAYYWLGETHYAQSDFPKAAEHFQKGFEAQTNGIKAPDNLYKLSKSLLNMNKKKEACIVLAQIQKRYKDRNPELAGLAFETEQSTACAN